MDLIAPGALWLLLLVAILLVLARRQTARTRRPVANLYMWSRPSSSASTEARFRRWRQQWLVFLQAAILSLIVFALSGPMLSWSTRPVALIVDLTASMGARQDSGTRMDQARHAALRTVDGLPRGARVRLFTAGRFTEELGEFAKADPRLAIAIRSLVPTATSGDLARAVRTVRTAMGSAPSITVISDRRDLSVVDADVQWIVVGQPAANQAVTAVAARRLPAASDSGQIISTVWNYAPAATSRELEIAQDGAVLSRQRIELGPRRSATVVTDVESIGRVITARLLDGDALAHDDERAAIVPSIEVARVRLVSAGSFFLERALATNPNVALENAASDADVVVCDRCTRLPPEGRAVLMIPASGTAVAGPLSVSLPDHPIGRMLDPGGVIAAGASTGPVAADGTVILRAGAAPAVIAYHTGGRRVVEMRLDIETPGFPLHPAFPVLLDNTVGWLTARGENPTAIAAGEPLRWNSGTPPAAGTVSVAGPQGRQVDVTVNGAIVTATDTGAPGIYAIRLGDVTQPFVVNPVSDGESDLSQAERAVATGAPMHEATATSRTNVATFLLVLALAVLALEWRVRTGRARVA